MLNCFFMKCVSRTGSACLVSVAVDILILQKNKLVEFCTLRKLLFYTNSRFSFDLK